MGERPEKGKCVIGNNIPEIGKQALTAYAGEAISVHTPALCQNFRSTQPVLQAHEDDVEEEANGNRALNKTPSTQFREVRTLSKITRPPWDRRL